MIIDAITSDSDVKMSLALPCLGGSWSWAAGRQELVTCPCHALSMPLFLPLSPAHAQELLPSRPCLPIPTRRLTRWESIPNRQQTCYERECSTGSKQQSKKQGATEAAADTQTVPSARIHLSRASTHGNMVLLHLVVDGKSPTRRVPGKRPASGATIH